MTFGYVKLHRKMLDSPVWQTNYYPQKILAITCLMMANHTAARLSYGGKVINLKPGQFYTSLDSLKTATGLSFMKIRTSIFNLTKLDFLTSKVTGKGRVISLMNWDTYQGLDSTNNKQLNKQVTGT